MELRGRVFLTLLLVCGLAVLWFCAEKTASTDTQRGEAGAMVMTLRPDCPSKCGDVLVPYPFGLRANCSLPGFELSCVRYDSVVGLKPNILLECILDVSLLQAQARILIRPSKICDSSNRGNEWSANLRNTPFAFSTRLNKFTAIGCDTLALLTGKTSGDYTVGCVSVCDTSATDAADNSSKNQSPDQKYQQVVDKICSGIGCCQSSIPSGLSSYWTTLRHLSIVKNTNKTANVSIDTSQTGECGFAFLAENRNYSFMRSDLKRQNTRDWYLQAVLDWAVGDQNCSEAQLNVTSYACKSDNSICLRPRTGFGYICNCSSGYQGNPYLVNGCQDIDECRDPFANPCYKGLAFVPSGKNRTCVNTPGGFSCSCPHGFTMLADICSPDKKKSNKIIFGIVIGVSGGLGTLLLLVGIGFTHKSLTKKRLDRIRKKKFKENNDMMLQQQLLYDKHENIVNRINFISMKELEKATNKFDNSRIVGRGGHGTVYKGILDLQVVAIKRSISDSKKETEQFINEILLLSQIRHRNVVRLLGCCLETEVPLLVYEFIPNGTLYDHLHSSHTESPLSWDDRLRIATEITSALAYMHTEANVSIFHRDIKSKNILLDDKLTVKLSDFGASKPIDSDKSYVVTKVEGTFGYLDPQYLHTGQLTEKTDVYSLGVILVELLTGKMPTSDQGSEDTGNTITRFIVAFKDGGLSKVLDASIVEDAKDEVNVVSKLAKACLSLVGEDRPTMKDIEHSLEGLINQKKGKLNKIVPIEHLDDKQLTDASCSSSLKSGSSTLNNTPREEAVKEVFLSSQN